MIFNGCKISHMAMPGTALVQPYFTYIDTSIIQNETLLHTSSISYEDYARRIRAQSLQSPISFLHIIIGFIGFVVLLVYRRSFSKKTDE